MTDRLFFHKLKKAELAAVKEQPAPPAKKRRHSRLHSFRFAWKGVRFIFRQELNFRLQVALMLLTLGLAGLLRCSITEWLILLACSGLVLAAEAANSALEELVDWLHENHHERAGKIKDMAAAIPLIASLFSLIAGLLIFIPKIIDLARSFFGGNF